MAPHQVDCEAVRFRLREMCESVERLDLQGCPIEPALVEVLEFVKSHPSCKQELVSVFAAMVVRGGGALAVPWELLPFCMHELRWAEVREVVRTALDDAIREQDWRAIPIYSHYMDSFDDDWDDADLFQYYSNRG